VTVTKFTWTAVTEEPIMLRVKGTRQMGVENVETGTEVEVRNELVPKTRGEHRREPRQSCNYGRN
jgi:hypothetical protein